MTTVWIVGAAAFETTMQEVFSNVQSSGERFRNIERAQPGTWAIGFMLLVSVVAPIFEEVIFRGFIYNALRKRMSNTSAVILQGLLFGVVHDYPITGMISVSAGGMLLAMVYRWRQTILAPMLLHCMFNGIVFASLLYSGHQRWESPIIGISPASDTDACVVEIVHEGSPAENSGLQHGDNITGLGDYRIETFEDLLAALQYYKPGDVVTVWFDRDQKQQTTEVELASRKALVLKQQTVRSDQP